MNSSDERDSRFVYLPATPIPDQAIRITAIETVVPRGIMAQLMLLRIHTDAGIIGHGETYMTPEAVAALIHDWMGRRLLGADALAIESHWRFLYERAANFGVRGAELRAISAIDLALWDILGQVCHQPIYRLLGGPVRGRIAVYNSCGNPSYGRRTDGGADLSWPGYGGIGQPGPLSDSYNLFHHPEELADELLAEGFGAMKTWPFDAIAHRHGGMRIALDDLETAVEPLRRIRSRVGNRLEIIVDGHGFFMLPAALRIAEALREVRPLWLEDILKMDNLATLADFRRRSRMPISASEMLLTRADFLPLLAKGGADYVMIDPTWCGGISESVRLAHLAQGFNIPCTLHDCTGPLTLFAGLHINAAVAGCCFQETVRAHVRSFYKDLIDPLPVIAGGHADLPIGAGLGTRLNPELFAANQENYRLSGKR
jgi:L-alanine-DL-glutamate epimerase-like enolase superfamily enzyme